MVVWRFMLKKYTGADGTMDVDPERFGCGNNNGPLTAGMWGVKPLVPTLIFMPCRTIATGFQTPKRHSVAKNAIFGLNPTAMKRS